MMYRATRTFGKYRVGEVYEISRPRLEDRSAIRTGLLVAVSGWCAPSEAVFSIPCPSFDAAEGILSLPEIVKEKAEQPARKARRGKKAAEAPLTLDALSKATSEALDDLRG